MQKWSRGLAVFDRVPFLHPPEIRFCDLELGISLVPGFWSLELSSSQGFPWVRSRNSTGGLIRSLGCRDAVLRGMGSLNETGAKADNLKKEDGMKRRNMKRQSLVSLLALVCIIAGTERLGAQQSPFFLPLRLESGGTCLG